MMRPGGGDQVDLHQSMRGRLEVCAVKLAGSEETVHRGFTRAMV